MTTKRKNQDQEPQRVEADAATASEVPPDEAVAEQPSAAEAAAAPESRVAELEDKLLRARAELKNVQRRAAVERSEALRFGNAELMRSLLGVVDDLERSLAASRETTDVASLVAGVQLIYDNMMKAMRDHGLEEIVAKDQPFDPNVHEAMLQQPSEDRPPGTVVDEIARGYKLHDRVLRPTKVVVAREADVPGTDNAG